MVHLIVEGVEVVLRVHGGLHPDRLRGAPVPPPQSVAGLCRKAGNGAQHMEWVILLIAQRGHVPGQLVHAGLYVLEVLKHNKAS